MKQVKPSFTGAKTLCALALLGAFSAQAQAQTSVTIYGRVVAGIDFQTHAGANGQGTKWSAANNQWGTSMIGFKGTEDLGGGNNAFFLLESGFNSTKGGFNGTDTSNSALFNRRSYVGLSSSSLGSIKFGKNLFINNDIWYLDPTGQQAIGTSVLVNQRNWPGASNVIEYASPDWGGFTVGLQTSLGEQAGSISKGPNNGAAGGSSDGRKDGISLAYQKNGLELRAIYDVVRDSQGNYTNVFAHSKEFILGGTYKIDKLKLFAGYENLRADSAGADPVATNMPASNGVTKVNHEWIGVNYDVTPQFQLVGGYFHATYNNNGGSANLYLAGVNYFLSKRTLLYFDLGTVRNNGRSSEALEWGSSTGVAGLTQTGGYFGIAHSF